jgi:hypothetical protein
MRNYLMLVLIAAFQLIARGDPSFTRVKLSDVFLSEGASVGDFNHDGKMDVVSGPYWYEGPDLKVRHEYYPAAPIDPHGYSKNFFAFVDDFNHDGWDDILIVGFPGESADWFENPKGKEGAWIKHTICKSVCDESPTYTDLKGDGKRELVCITDGRFGYYEPDEKDANAAWIFHPISPKGPWQRFTHGLGVGDVNGDGKPDILEKNGWWEQPKSLEGDPVWAFHAANFGDGGSQMYVYDVNGDGKPDVICALQAHGYGLAWFEQKKSEDRSQKSEGGEIEWVKHVIMGMKAEENPQGVLFTEPHAVDLVDIDGDGLKDIVTGKRWWAHGPHGDPDAMGPAILYWFQLKRNGNSVEWVAHKIDDDSGVGTQVLAKDVNGDGKPDIVVGNKKGTFVFLQR